MNQALISPNEQIFYVSDWSKTSQGWVPIIQVINNSARIAEISLNPFPVAEPLFWIECNDNISAELYYYDLSDSNIKLIPESPPMPQPVVEGAQTL